MEKNKILHLQNVSKIYQMGSNKLYALNDISLDIHEGEFLAVLGPSGSGKSTLLNILGGTDRCSEGEIIFNGENISRISDGELTSYRRNNIGFVFQFYNLLPMLTAIENVEVSVEISENPMNAKEALELVELTDHMDHFPAQMSGGQQQRVAIARALASNPKILLCDEPTGALDSNMSKKILDILLTACKNLNKTIIMITHNHELSKIANRIIKIKDGKLEDIIIQENPITVEALEW